MPETSELAAHFSRFLKEQAAAWTDVLNLHEMLREAFTRRRNDFARSGSLQEAIRRIEDAGRSMYLDVYSLYERYRPVRRTLSVIEELDSTLGTDAGLRRARIDGAMQLLLARAILRLRDPWVIYCNAQRKFLESNTAPDCQAGEWSEWTAALESDKRTADRVMARYRQFFSKLANQEQSKPSRRRTEAYERNMAFWWRRQRTVAASLECEARMIQMDLESLRITDGTIDALRVEREELRRALRKRVEYLHRWEGGPYEPPDADARIISPEERLDAWQYRIDRALGACLPEEVETTNPRGTLPSFLNRWRTIEPRKAYRNSMEQTARPALAAGLARETELNLALAREMERANEVVLYARTAARESGEGLLVEALTNAQALLERCDQSAPAETAAWDRAAEEILTAAGREAGAVIEVGRAGLLALLTKRQGRRLILIARSFTQKLVERALTRVVSRVSLWAAAVQVKFGWKLPTRPVLPPVVHRIHLREALDLEADARELPALYRRLFRLSPVEDPRFLVGRDEEMHGFEQAFEAWRSGCFAACLLVGARGSGKTSLLNCAASGLFAGETVVRAQFSERLTEPEQMDRYVQGLPGTRRIVLLEEIERTFVKSFNGFAAICRLQEIIQSSASSTLWILAMNDFAFQLLDQAVRLGASFSHRINAMSVLRDDLVKAILQRHNLSGLRLSFAPPPPGDPRVSRIRSLVGIKEDPETMFFDSLYEQSGGVFRSAFELWQSSIHRAEGGMVKMKQPLAPDFQPVRRELNQMDHFSLLAIQQHGSLTDEELAVVLLEPVGTSRMRLDRLAALDIVEPDPDHRGMRVRPEAQLFVNDLLQRINLI